MHYRGTLAAEQGSLSVNRCRRTGIIIFEVEFSSSLLIKALQRVY